MPVDLSVMHFSPGQECMLHTRRSIAAPGQVFPPFLGGGWVQLRVRACVPDSQDLVQAVHTPQLDQPPSTVKLNRRKAKISR